MEHNSATGTAAGEQSEQSTALLQYEWHAKSEQPEFAVIWLHGLGADGYDFVPVAQAMSLTAQYSPAYCFPHAPMRPVTINNGMVMRAWYDIMGFDLRRDQDRNGIQQSIRQVEQLRDHLNERGIPYQRQIIAGFSQGGVIALRAGLASERPPLAILALSCYLADPETLADWSYGDERNMPLFMGHGSQDPVVPIQLGERARDTLTAAGYQVCWQQYPIPHSVSPNEIMHIDEWLSTQIKSHLTQAG